VAETRRRADCRVAVQLAVQLPYSCRTAAEAAPLGAFRRRYGAPWDFLDTPGGPLGASRLHDGAPWDFLGIHGNSWKPMGILGNPRVAPGCAAESPLARRKRPSATVDRIPVSRDPVHGAPGGFLGGPGGLLDTDGNSWKYIGIPKKIIKIMGNPWGPTGRFQPAFWRPMGFSGHPWGPNGRFQAA